MRHLLLKKLWEAICVISFFTLISTPAYAIPTLQLDIQGGTYSGETQTIVASRDAFSLYAYLYEPDKKDRKAALDSLYYLSMAISPRTSKDADLGSFTANGIPIHATSDMDYGTPPLDQNLVKSGLPPHSVFPTFYYETTFKFQDDKAHQVAPYNTQNRSLFGIPTPKMGSGTGMYAEEFTIDVSNLYPGQLIHFDLYSITKGKISFAPFSHDAESAPKTNIPEPSTLLFLGSGLLGLYPFIRRKFK